MLRQNGVLEYPYLFMRIQRSAPLMMIIAVGWLITPAHGQSLLELLQTAHQLLLPQNASAAAQEHAVLYEGLGWVNTTRAWFRPLCRAVNPVPRARAAINTTVRLFTRSDPERGRLLLGPPPPGDHAPALALAPLGSANCTRPVKVLFHGWSSSPDVPWMQELRRRVLEREDAWVLAVGWASGGVAYPQAAQDARVVALEAARVLRALGAACALDPSALHLIGHSLGAHVAGYVGAALPGVARISGLDPAGPMFHSMPDIVRLDRSDAAFVDVIHTDSTGLGSEEATGHVDYYPNGGETQPGCSLWTFLELNGLMALFTETEELFTCSHTRAVRLFIHSMQPRCRFLACRCPSMRSFRQGACTPGGDETEDCAFMGYDFDPRVQRYSIPSVKMYLTTAAHPPYCRTSDNEE